MIQIDNCQLVVDTNRGVLYVHSSDGISLVRICQIPQEVIRLSYDKEVHTWLGLVDLVYDRDLARRRIIRDVVQANDYCI